MVKISIQIKSYDLKKQLYLVLNEVVHAWIRFALCWSLVQQVKDAFWLDKTSKGQSVECPPEKKSDDANKET